MSLSGSSGSIDRDLLSNLVVDSDLESVRNAVKKHEIWEEIASEYSAISGSVMSGKQVAKAWNNTKYRRSAKAAKEKKQVQNIHLIQIRENNEEMTLEIPTVTKTFVSDKVEKRMTKNLFYDSLG